MIETAYAKRICPCNTVDLCTLGKPYIAGVLAEEDAVLFSQHYLIHHRLLDFEKIVEI